MEFKIIPYGSSALLIQFKNEISLEVHQQVISIYHSLLNEHLTGITAIIPAYNSITIRYNHETTFAILSNIINTYTTEDLLKPIEPKKVILIPVCYDESLAIDIQFVKEHTSLSQKEIITIHTNTSYPVYMLGFTPGFPYLGGLDSKLHTPRKKTPRLKTPKGAIGLANNQTGIYPNESPGGWQIIGQTPTSLFTAGKLPLINIGDSVRFESISLNEYNQLNNEG